MLSNDHQRSPFVHKRMAGSGIKNNIEEMSSDEKSNFESLLVVSSGQITSWDGIVLYRYLHRRLAAAAFVLLLQMTRVSWN